MHEQWTIDCLVFTHRHKKSAEIYICWKNLQLRLIYFCKWNFSYDCIINETVLRSLFWFFRIVWNSETSLWSLFWNDRSEQATWHSLVRVGPRRRKIVSISAQLYLVSRGALRSNIWTCVGGLVTRDIVLFQSVCQRGRWEAVPKLSFIQLVTWTFILQSQYFPFFLPLFIFFYYSFIYIYTSVSLSFYLSFASLLNLDIKSQRFEVRVGRCPLLSLLHNRFWISDSFHSIFRRSLESPFLLRARLPFFSYYSVFGNHRNVPTILQ